MNRGNGHLVSLSAPSLQSYVLGTVEFETVLRFQRRLHFDVSGERTKAALILCEHGPVITVGRQGSRAHILLEPEELRARQWSVRWVNRAGGCWLQVPGQLAIYPVLPLDCLGLGVQAYLDHLHLVIQAVLDDFGIRGYMQPGKSGIWVQSRMIAAVGVAVRDWVSYFGIVLNINPALHLFQHVRSGRLREPPMTSVERERRGPLRPSLVRERFLEHFQAQFGFPSLAFFSDHPCLHVNGRQKPGSRVAIRG